MLGFHCEEPKIGVSITVSYLSERPMPHYIVEVDDHRMLLEGSTNAKSSVYFTIF